ncbi:ATP-binding protein [Bacillus sp. 2205SS5-2]|uniref:ATP-binding protein n=1 Tax=Bacillus sp. 2205SS5-2 TaxID=3109031 RepID=UPI003004CB80
MELMINTLLLNHLFILVVTIIGLLILDHYITCFSSVRRRRVFIFIVASISIIFCIVFSFQLTSDFQYDLRIIPMILGGLYGGPWVALGLFLVTMSVRAITEGYGILSTLINNGLFLLIAGMLSKKFWQYSSKKRIVVGSLLISLSPMFAYTVANLLWGLYIPIEIILVGMFVCILCMFMIVLIVEFIINHYLLKHKMVYAEKMEMVSSMAASVSHEIRNPLTTTKGFLQLLKETETDSVKLQYVTLSLSELERAEEVINDFLTFAKPTLDQFQTLSLKDEVDELIEVIRPMANMNSVQIVSEIEDFAIRGDKNRFRQALLNLLKNSIEAMPTGGSLSLKTNTTKEEGILVICDSGIGMTAEQIKRLGEPFFTTKNHNGTGLGMMVTYQILEQMSVKMYAQSKLGEGSSFRLVFSLMPKSRL